MLCSGTGMRTVWGERIKSTSISDNELCDLKFDIHRVPVTAVEMDLLRALQIRVWDR